MKKKLYNIIRETPSKFLYIIFNSIRQNEFFFLFLYFILLLYITGWEGGCDHGQRWENVDR